MLEQHKSHIVSTCSTVMQHLAEIRQVATTGKTPGGRQAAALPEQLGESLLTKLDAVAAGLEALVKSSAPDRRKTSAESSGTGASLMWVNILLRTVEELIRDLLPDPMGRQYGALSPVEAGRLQSWVGKVLESLHEAMLLTEQRHGSRSDQPASSD